MHVFFGNSWIRHMNWEARFVWFGWKNNVAKTGWFRWLITQSNRSCFWELLNKFIANLISQVELSKTEENIEILSKFWKLQSAFYTYVCCLMKIVPRIISFLSICCRLCSHGVKNTAHIKMVMYLNVHWDFVFGSPSRSEIKSCQCNKTANKKEFHRLSSLN